jgi:hypothetical protein
LAVCAISHADMMPLSPLDVAEYRQSPPTITLTDPRPASPSIPYAGLLDTPNLDPLPVAFLLQPTAEAGQPSETKPAQILTDRQNSVALCLYALLGVGLCQSAPLVRKLHVGSIPDWYCSGRPYQIGHSIAISPDCLIAVPAVCFIQPGCLAAQDSLIRYRLRTVASLWRKSQLTATVLASRGPPSH